MQFLVMVKATDKSEAGEMPSPELIARMGAFNEELIKAGAMLGGGGLKPTSASARIKFDNGKPLVMDGPFTESKELVAGYWLLQFKSTPEAIEWMKRVPFQGDEQIEIRPLFEPEDFK